MAVPLRRRSRADRSPRRARGPASGASCGSSTAARSWTTPRGPCGPPATRRATGSRSSRRPRALLRDADLATVSRERVEAELRKLAAEPEARPGLRAAGRVGRCSSSARTPGRLVDAAVASWSARSRGRASPPARTRCWRRRWAAGSARRAQLAAATPAPTFRGGRAGPRAQRGRAGARPGAGRRVARPLRRRVARGAARDRRRRPARAGGPRGRRSGAASPRRCGRSSTGRSHGREEELRAALAAAREDIRRLEVWRHLRSLLSPR